MTAITAHTANVTIAMNRAGVTAVFYGTPIISTDAADLKTAGGYRAMVIAPGELAFGTKTALTAHTADIITAADLAEILAVRRVTSSTVSADTADILIARNRSIVDALIQDSGHAQICIGLPAHSADIIFTRKIGIPDRYILDQSI